MKSQKEIRLEWVKLYLQTKNSEQVCLKCGISPPTLRKWVRRYEEGGEEALADQSRRLHSSPNRKVLQEQEKWILELRKRRLGVRRIQNELRRLHKCKLSLATIHKVLTANKVAPLHVHASRKPRHTAKRYSRPVPYDRVQLDTCQIAPKLYQYTAVDDCTVPDGACTILSPHHLAQF
jgi:transposase-like protein